MDKESGQQEQCGLEPGREPGVLCLRVQSVVGERGGEPGRTGPEARGTRMEDKQDGAGLGDTIGKSQEGGRGTGKGINV